MLLVVSDLTLLKPSHSFELREAPSHLLTPISLAVEPSVGNSDDLLCFHPNGLSENPLYRLKFDNAEADLESSSVGLLREEVRVGIGVLDGAPAIVKAMFILIFIASVARMHPFSIVPSQICLDEIIFDRQYFDVRCEAAKERSLLVV